MNYCHECGSPLSTGAKFCPNCGTRVPDETAEIPLATPVDIEPILASLPEDTPQPEVVTPAENRDYEPIVTAARIEPPPAYAQPPVRPDPPRRPEVKRIIGIPLPIFIIIAAAIIVVICVVVGIIVYSTLAKNSNITNGYYIMSGDAVPSVELALGDERKLQSTKLGKKDGIETLTIDYKVSGGGQGADILSYLTYLIDDDDFVELTPLSGSLFKKPVGSTIQVARNSSKPGYMVIVQADYDNKGYTITVMLGEGQTAAVIQTTPEPIQTTPEPTHAPPAPTADTTIYTAEELLPDGEPTSTNVINDWSIRSYADGTVSIGTEDSAIITPDGKIYILGEFYSNAPAIPLPSGGTQTSVNGVDVYVTDSGELYVVANGSMLYVDADKIGFAYDAP
ncbi:MAG: zinc-ribbon domain-containing protein [Oscillospiraceae bacterium]|jgi:hypothetical protein|nr:zinc-ribbon domain-containing protein [Oscillospiraceae bacterium]